MTRSEIKAIIFDFDGVIIDSVRLKINIFLQCYEGEIDSRQADYICEHQARHGGVGRAAKFRHFEEVLFGRTADDQAIERLMEHYQTFLFAQIDDCPLLPGAIDFLNKARKTCLLHLVSGTLHDDLLRIVEARNLTPYFKTIIGSPTTKSAAFASIVKADPFSPRSILAIGDSMTEYDAARACAVQFIGIVAPNEVNRFPEQVPIYQNLHDLAAVWD